MNNPLELNCSWHFAKQHVASLDIGPNNAAAEHFTATPYPSLIRESIQNSLDVVLDRTKPVRMKFEFGKMRSKTFQGFFELKDHIKGVLDLYGDKAKPLYKDMLDNFDKAYQNQSLIEYIKVSDFNTKGMDYKPDNSPFHAFVRALGLTIKDESSSGGSFGFGKAAYFAMSPIRTVLVSTKTHENKLFFEGAASLCTHLFPDENGNLVKYQSHGYYDNQNGERPASKEEDIPTKFRREEVGTDIYIMGIDGSEDARKVAYDEMIKATLRHFWMSILHGLLEVEIGDIVINADSLEELMGVHYPMLLDKNKSGENYNPRPYYEAVKRAGTSKEFIRIDKTLPLLGNVSLYVWKNKDARDGFVHMRKQRMFIHRARHYTDHYGYYGVFLCTDDWGNKYLQSIEDPSHSKWQSGRNKKDGQRIYNEYCSFIKESIVELFRSNSNGPLGIADLDKYLFVPEDLLNNNAEGSDNPFFGGPSGEVQDEGASPTSEGQSDVNISDPSGSNSPGNVVIHTTTGGRPGGTDHGGRTRGPDKKKRKGKGQPGGHIGFTPDTETDGELITNIPVAYRVMAETINGILYHTVVIHSDYDVDNGSIEILINGEEKDEVVNIVSSSTGNPHGNEVRNLAFKAGDKTIVQLKFEDDMKHAIKLKAYELK